MESLDELLQRVRACRICEKQLPVAPRPCLSASVDSKILIIGQSPGLKVYQSQSGTLFNDASGERLRAWLGVDKQQFYDPKNFSILPIGFCYTGKGKTGDNPPMKICAPTWHKQISDHLNKVQLVILVGSYGQSYYLNNKQNLTYNVKNFKDFLPRYFPIPHPSARNFIWLNKNPWFSAEVLPILKQKVKQILEL